MYNEKQVLSIFNSSTMTEENQIYLSQKDQNLVNYSLSVNVLRILGPFLQPA